MRNSLKSILLSLLICSVCYAPVIGPLRGQILPLGSRYTRDVVGYWPMNGGSGNKILDLSGNGNTGTFAGDPQWVGGKFDWALDFDGMGDYINLGSPELLKFASATADFSVVAWIRRITTDDEYIIDFREGNDDGWDLRFVSDSLWCQLDAADVKSSSTITDTNWHQVGVVINRTGNGQMYIDGFADGSPVDVSAQGVMAITANMNIGGTNIGGGGAFFTGKIDHILIYNRALTAAEIRQLYMRGGDPLVMNRGWRPMMYAMPTGVGYSGRGVGRGVGRGIGR